MLPTLLMCAVGGGDLTDYAFVDDLEVEGALVGDCG